MRVKRSKARELVVSHVKAVLAGENVRLRCPGEGPISIAQDKSMYLELRLVYMDGWSTGLGKNSDMRLMGMIEVKFCLKEGNSADYLKSERLMDTVQSAIHSTDAMAPVRTYGTRQETQRLGPAEGWVVETLVTPFWYDTSKL